MGSPELRLQEEEETKTKENQMRKVKQIVIKQNRKSSRNCSLSSDSDIIVTRQRSSVVEQRFRNSWTSVPMCAFTFKIERLC